MMTYPQTQYHTIFTPCSIRIFFLRKSLMIFQNFRIESKTLESKTIENKKIEMKTIKRKTIQSSENVNKT